MSAQKLDTSDIGVKVVAPATTLAGYGVTDAAAPLTLTTPPVNGGVTVSG